MDWRHHRPFRIALLVFVSVIALVWTIPYFVSLEPLRSGLSSSVARKTGRTLAIRGDARLVVLPRPALLLDNVSLSEPNRPDIFASTEHARIGLAVWPLISRGELQVSELEFDQPKIAVLRGQDGQLNFEDLLARGNKTDLNFGVEEFHLNAAELRFSDEFLGNTALLSGLELDLSNLADPKNGKLEANGKLVIGKPGAAIDWQGKLIAGAAMRYNAEERRLLVADIQFDLQQQGPSAAQLRLNDGQLQVTGNLVYGWQPLRLTGGELKLAGAIVRAGQKWKLDLDLPEIRMHEDRLALNKLKLAASMQSANGNFSATVNVPVLAGEQHSLLRADAAKIDMRINNPDQNLALTFVSPLELRQGTKVVLPAYRLTGSYGNRSLPRGAIPFDLQGEGTLDLRNEYFDLASRGTLDQSAITASLHQDDFVNPRYRVDLDLAKLDLSPYLPAVAANAKTIDQDELYDLWWLDRLEAEGAVRIGELVLQKLHINNLAFKLAAAKRKLVLDPLSATIYEGSLTGRAELDANRQVPALRVQQHLSNMNINPLLADVLGSSRFEGRGFMDLDIAAVGRKISDIRRTSGGNVRISLSKGAIRGIDVEAVLRAASRQLKIMNGENVPAQPANLEAKTRFSELKASLALRHGIASNNDLAVTAGVLKLAGNGQFDLGAGSIDYTIKASANPKVPELADIAGLILPINFSGQFSAPEYKVDYAGLREQIMARQQAAAAAKAAKTAAVKAPAKQTAKPAKKKQ